MAHKRLTANDYLKKYNDLTKEKDALYNNILKRFNDLCDLYPDMLIDKFKLKDLKSLNYTTLDYITFINIIEENTEKNNKVIQKTIFDK